MPAADPAQLRVYASAETHTWIQKAADMCGLGTDAIAWIPTDGNLRMDVAALRRQIEADKAAGDIPCMVVGTAGSVGTGVVDPLRRHQRYLQGAGPLVSCRRRLRRPAPRRSPTHRRICGCWPAADSVAVDPHKWLYAPLEAGCALVRDADRLRAAFAYHPPYYHFDQRVTNYVDYGPQNSRGFRALKVWLALRHAGAAGYRRMIADDMRLAREMADAVRRCGDLELVTQSLSITTFRCVPPDLRSRLGDPEVERHLDLLNRTVLDRLQRGGEAFVSNAVVGNRYVLRACIVNFHTTRADVQATVDIAARLGREVNAELTEPGRAAGTREI